MGLLKMTDTGMDVVKKLSQGNPGALSVLCQAINEDPDLGFLHLMKLDDMGVYGPLIWLLYKDTFGCNLKAFYFALTRNRLGKVIDRKIQLSPAFAREWTYYKSRYMAGEFHFA